MDGRGKGGKGGARKAARGRAGSSSSKASKGKTPTTTALEEETTRVATMAAEVDAKAKAHQRKMTEFVQGAQGALPQGGAGELGSGPSGSAVVAGAGELVSGPSGPTATRGQGQAQGQGAAPQDGAGGLAAGPSGPAVEATAATATPGTPRQVQFSTQAMVHKAQAQEPQEQVQGAGELGAGPSNLGKAAVLSKGDDRSLGSQVAAIQEQLRHYRTQAEQGQSQDPDEIAVVDVIPPPQQVQQDGGWQTYVSRKNRKIGGQLEDQHQAREPTPFKMPGHQSTRGYYPSVNERNRVRMDQGRSNKSSLVAALTPRQWEWYKQRVCLACGEDHQVRFCKKVTKEQGFALVRATKNCPPGMRPHPLPQDRVDRPGQQGQGAPGAVRPDPAATATSATTAAAATPSRPSTKRPREASGAGLPSGLTPEAKKARQFSDAARESLTLYVREKDGSALTEERYVSLKTSFAYYVEDMITHNKDPPICGGRWTHSRAVVKIPMAGEMDLLFMRCFLDKSYLVQNGEEYNKSKGQVFVAFLKDRLDPELTGMRPEKLASFIKFYKRSMKIEGLFELKLAFKTPKGKAIHLVMDDKAAEVFVKSGRQIPMAGSGFIEFEDRATYLARIKEQERTRQQPRKSVLAQGIMEQQADVSKMSVDEAPAQKEGEEEELGEKRKPPSDKEVARAQEIVAMVGQGAMSAWRATQTYLEETGRDLEEVAPVFRRTTSGSSWSEEVEHAKSLEVPATLSRRKALIRGPM